MEIKDIEIPIIERKPDLSMHNAPYLAIIWKDDENHYFLNMAHIADVTGTQRFLQIAVRRPTKPEGDTVPCTVLLDIDEIISIEQLRPMEILEYIKQFRVMHPETSQKPEARDIRKELNTHLKKIFGKDIDLTKLEEDEDHE